jgi:chorismate synthase
MLKFLTAGESHGPALMAILDGMIAGVPLDEETIAADLERRQKGYGSGGRMRIERDRARITAGVMNGLTTGGPIGLLIENRDWKNWQEKDIEPFTTPRPGHADLTGAVKYGYRDLRLSLERASARETAARVAVGAICKRLLAQFGIEVGSYVQMIGGVEAELSSDVDEATFRERFGAAEMSDVRCPDADVSAAMQARIKEAIKAKDTLGGVFEVAALGVPAGLGSHVQWDRRIDGLLMGAVGSIPAIKGVAVGPAFANALKQGTQVHDPILLGGDGSLTRPSNRAGGVEGGITNGQPVIVRAAMKPISTTINPLPTVDLASGEPSQTVYERSDYCAVHRASIVGEAMVAWVLAAALLEKLGGDSLVEIKPRLEALRQARLDDLPMDDQPWRFGFSE